MIGTSLERRAVVVTWTAGVGDVEEVQLFFERKLENGETDVSNTDPRANDGEAVVTVPFAFAGETSCEIRDLDGNVLEGPEQIAV